MNGRRLRAGMSAIVALLALAGCDDGPRGPGKLEAIVAGEALGGVLLQVDGPGIQSFSAHGDARVYASSDEVRPGRFRVIVISPASGDLRFSIHVDDLDMEAPSVMVLQATRADNRLVTPSAATVRIVR